MTIATERTHAQRIQPNRHNKPNLTERKMQTCRCPDPSGCADPLTSPCLDTGSWDGQGSRGTLARTASPHGTPRYRIHPARPQNVHLCNRNPGHCLPLHRAGCGSGQKTVSFRKRLKTATWQPWHNGMTPTDSRRKNVTTRTVGVVVGLANNNSATSRPEVTKNAAISRTRPGPRARLMRCAISNASDL